MLLALDVSRPGFSVVKALLGTVIACLLSYWIPVTGAIYATPVLTAFGVDHISEIERRWMGHTILLGLALVAIALLKRVVPNDYGLHMPRGRSYAGPAVLFGLVSGVVMVLVDNGHALFSGSRPALPFDLDWPSVSAWLSFEGLFVGQVEEIASRALLLPFLAVMIPVSLRLGAYRLSAGALLVAILFALGHLGSFGREPLSAALGQQAYAFVWALFYAYWFEQSRSVVAPGIAHALGDLTEYVLLIAWVACR